MSLQPSDIEHQQFKERFRGYDQDEVDRFLDRVSERLGELQRERDEAGERQREAERRAQEVQAKSEEGLEAEVLLKRTLVIAQRAAEETVAEAEATAAQQRAEATEEVADLRERTRVEAEDLLAAARIEAEEVVAAARREAGDLLADARWRSDRVRLAIEELQRFRNEYRDRVRGVIAEHLALLDRAGELPEIAPGLEQLVVSPDEPSGMS